MPVAAAVAGSVLSAGVGMYSAKKAAKAQRKAAEQAIAAQQAAFERQAGYQQPFIDAGQTAQNEMMRLLGLGGDATSEGYGSAAQAFGTDQFEADPGYAFRQAEGMKALERSAAARGNLLSGSTLKGIQRFGQDLASQEYQNAFNRYQTERAARLNPLMGITGSGQTAANAMTSAAGNLGQNEAQGYMNVGQARASGYMGMGNALSSAIGSATNAYLEAPLLNAMTGYYNRGAGNASFDFNAPGAINNIGIPGLRN